ncbi:hypothetical protein Q1695_014341 [Nippostrongylus brasiliensis]|nr:hypothetical protein Q1695_014341 [Nippostrongylus brasiliensis]
MKVLHIPLLDDESTELTPFFTTVFKEIDDARKSAGRVLLLCAMGISRSATFAIAYLMCIEKMTLHDAYKHVQYCRNIICPNVGFFQQMIDLEQKLYGKKTVRIIEPISGVRVADVVWNELYQEMMDSLSETDRHSVRSFNPRPERSDSARQQDTRSLRSLNLVGEGNVDEAARELSACRLSELSTDEQGSVQVESAPRIPSLVFSTSTPYPKSALRDKSKNGKSKKRWRLSFSKDVS